MQRDRLEEAAEFMQMFAEPARLHIIYTLHRRGELSVTKIQKETDYTQSLVSRHLRYLTEGEVVVVRSNNQERLYSINSSKDIVYVLLPLIEVFFLKDSGKSPFFLSGRVGMKAVNEVSKQKNLFE